MVFHVGYEGLAKAQAGLKDVGVGQAEWSYRCRGAGAGAVPAVELKDQLRGSKQLLEEGAAVAVAVAVGPARIGNKANFNFRGTAGTRTLAHVVEGAYRGRWIVVVRTAESRCAVRAPSSGRLFPSGRGKGQGRAGQGSRHSQRSLGGDDPCSVLSWGWPASARRRRRPGK
jgi:hypothetical protein